jgi:uncharacterized phage-associated protein
MIKFEFNTEKSINALLYISWKLGKADFHKVFKILYFADRGHLATYGRTITGDTYIKMAAGPVPSKTYDILKAVRGDSYFSKYAIIFTQRFIVEEKHYIKPLVEPDMDFLSVSDIEELDKSINTYKDKTFKELVNISHAFAWKNAADTSPISFEDMLKEVDEDEEFINYLSEFSHLNAVLVGDEQ